MLPMLLLLALLAPPPIDELVPPTDGELEEEEDRIRVLPSIVNEPLQCAFRRGTAELAHLLYRFAGAECGAPPPLPPPPNPPPVTTPLPL